MSSRIVLVSDDLDFYEYIAPKLRLRKSDELYRFCFDEIPEKLHMIQNSLLILNSERAEKKTIELLSILRDNPAIVFSFNNDDDYRTKCYKAGAFDFFSISTPPAELEAKILLGLKIISSYEKNEMYREILVSNHLLAKNNDVFMDSNAVLDKEIAKIQNKSLPAVLIAISPNEKTKFLLQPNQIETIILNNMRKTDILMNYAPNKYFILLYNSDTDNAKKIWDKIRKTIPEDIYAGFARVGNKTRQQLVSEVLNKLHENINNSSSGHIASNAFSGNNFKFFRQEFNKKIEQVIAPVFYHIQQIYTQMSLGMQIEQGIGEGYGVLYIRSRHATGSFRITSPGFSKVNIDITYNSAVNNSEASDNSETKRITLEPEELEEGLLQDLIEQFILEFKRGNDNDNTQ